jgi:MFS family permease
MATLTNPTFRRDRLTWIAYALLAWFAYLQAAPGLVIAHLRDELDLSYSTGGLHIAAFAAGALVAGVISAPLERVIGRRALFWSAAAVMGAGAIGLTAGRVAAATVGSLLVMGVGGGLLLVTIQAALADRHGERRAVALVEANVAASIAYVVLIGGLSLTAALGADWRVALLASLAVPALAWWSNRRLAIDAPPPSEVAQGSLPAVFWIAAAMLFCTTAAGGASTPGARRSWRTPPTCGRTLRSRSWPATSAACWPGARSAAGWRAGTIRRGCSRSRWR